MKPICVLGVVDNEVGLAIMREMLEWLEPHYKVIVAHHDGTKFEQPALRYMQDMCRRDKVPCLYLHTKGAFNRSVFSEKVRDLWRHEFTEKKELYFGLVDRPYAAVACPFTGDDKTTWYNGFVTNWQAMAEHPLIEPRSNRHKFERLFCGTNTQVFGVIRNDVHRRERHIDAKMKEIADKI